MKVGTLSFLAITVLAFCPLFAFGKRAAPAPVETVERDSVRYIAPNQRGAFIEAWDVRSGRKLWDLLVFTNNINPDLEQDVQWVFIKSLSVRGDNLIVTSERGDAYKVSLKTKVVTRLWRLNKPLEIIIAAIVVLALAIFLFRPPPKDCA